MNENVLAPLVQYGAIGVILVVSLLALRALYQELSAERAARIQDAKDNTALLLRIQQATADAIDKLYEIAKSTRGDR